LIRGYRCGDAVTLCAFDLIEVDGEDLRSHRLFSATSASLLVSDLSTAARPEADEKHGRGSEAVAFCLPFAFGRFRPPQWEMETRAIVFSGVVSSFSDPAGTWAWRPVARQAAGAPALLRAEPAVQPRAAEAPLRAEAAVVVWLRSMVAVPVASAARPAASADGPPWSAAVSVASSDRC
jgi:hypothetical protein